VPVYVADHYARRAAVEDIPLGRYLSELLRHLAKEAGAKPLEAPPRRPVCDPEKPACAYSLEGAACSISASLIVPKKGTLGIDKIPARYCLLEVESLKTSHNPLTGFGVNRDYPEGAQERDYRQANEQQKVFELAREYEPSLIFNTSPGALDGLPIVTEDKVVLGGNGRTMASVLVYHGEGGVPATTPRDYLVDHASEFGFSPSDIDKFRHPMVIRTIRTEATPKVLADWSRRLNLSMSQALDRTRLAVSRARFLDEKALDELKVEDEETLVQFLSSQRSLPFVKALAASGVIDARSAAQYLSQGLLTADGRALVTDLLLAVLIPDADEIHALGEGPTATLAKSAPYLIQTRALGKYSLLEPFRKAIKDRIAMRAAQYGKVSEFLQQIGLFKGSSATSEGDPLAVLLLEILTALDAAPVKLAKLFKRYLSLARAPASGQAGLFAREELSPLEALRQVAREVGVI
jgi:hypothetical protein